MAWTWSRSALADVLRPCIAPHRMRAQSVNGCQRVVCLARVRARDPRAMGWVPREGEEQRARG